MSEDCCTIIKTEAKKGTVQPMSPVLVNLVNDGQDETRKEVEGRPDAMKLEGGTAE